MTTTEKLTRAVPPPLALRAPDCSVCGKETSWDEGWDCEDCGIHWPENLSGTDTGEWLDDEETQCRWEVQPWRDKAEAPGLQGHRYRCLLADGHEHGQGKPADRVDHVGLRADKTGPSYADDTLTWWHSQNEHYNASQLEEVA